MTNWLVAGRLTGRQPFADGVEWAKGKSVLQQVEEAVVPYPARLWKGISKAAKDLVQQLLQANPAERLVGLEVLSHPWMADSKVAKRHKRGPLQSSDSIYMSPSRLPNKGSSTQSLSEEAQAAAAGGDGGKVSLNGEESKAEEAGGFLSSQGLGFAIASQGFSQADSIPGEDAEQEEAGRGEQGNSEPSPQPPTPRVAEAPVEEPEQRSSSKRRRVA